MLPASRPRNRSFPSLFEPWPSIFDSVPGLSLGGVVGVDRGVASLDIIEEEECYKVYMDAAGVTKEDLEISLEGDTLSIQMKRSTNNLPEEAKAVHRERWSGEVSRSIRLPEAARGENVDAKLENGVLTLTLEKQPSSRTRRIEIK